MTFPGGAPGGFPGQQPQQGPGYGPPAGGMKLGLPQILTLVAAGLGLLNLFLGLAPVASAGGEGQSFYESAVGWIPILYFIAGAAAANGMLPKSPALGAFPALAALGAVLAQLFSISAVPEGADMGAGFIMILIFGIVQLGVSVVAYLFDAGIIKSPQPNQFGHQQQFGAPQTGGFGAPQQGQFGQQPPAQPGQQTTYAPQQGQFGQQPPGTPPGGFGGQA